MRSIQNIRLLLFLTAFVAMSSRAMAHVNAYLYIDDSTGKEMVVKINSDGTFQTPRLHVGTYTWSFRVKSGMADATTGDNPKETVASAYSISITPHIQPPDAASGHPTGRRMHKPLSVMKVLDRSTPGLTTALGTFTIDVNGDGLAGTVTAYTQGGKTMNDAWDAK